mgnify:CR=1 FL=1
MKTPRKGIRKEHTQSNEEFNSSAHFSPAQCSVVANILFFHNAEDNLPNFFCVGKVVDMGMVFEVGLVPRPGWWGE